MSPERWERLMALFESAERLEPADREAFLRRECPDDPELAAEVLDMLAEDVPTSFIRSPLAPRRPSRETDPCLEGREVEEFRVIRRLGSGGSGVVYLAEQPRLCRLVALKVLPREGRDERTLQRFAREAIAAAALEHPHIVAVFASGAREGREGFAWYAMRYVRGWDLNEELERQRGLRTGRSEGPLAWPPFDGPDYTAHAVERLAALADAIAHAHVKGIVHRDVKPHNVMLDERGEAHLTDFGIALDERFGSLTQTGGLQGTPFYMSPEQLRTLDQSVDHRTDVYSLGVVLYEVLSLRRPFEGRTSQEVFQRISREDPPPLSRANPRVPLDLTTIVGKAMAKKPGWRYATAAELAADLRRFLRHETIVARPPSRLERCSRWTEKHRVGVLAATAIVLALALGAAVAAGFSRHAREAAEIERIERALAADPSVLPEDELIALRLRVDELAAERSALSTELARAVARAERWFEEHRRAERDLLEAQRAVILAPVLPELGAEVQREVEDTALATFHLRAERAALLHPRDPELASLARVDSTWPRLELRLHPRHPPVPGLERARVFLRRIDSYASERGEEISVGGFPLEATAVPPGEYFVVVDLPGFGFAELRRWLRPRLEPYTFDVSLRETRAVLDLERMKAIPAGSVALAFPEPGHLGCFAAGARAEVGAFHVELATASNAEFERYLRESEDAPPELWTELGYRPDGRHLPSWSDLVRARESEWNELPAVGFTYAEALSYLEWRGLSLPLHHEAERYLRGAEGWLAPNQPPSGIAAPADAGFVNAIDPRVTPAAGSRPHYELYLIHAQAVRARPYRQAPEGLFHALGNVAEYTASGVVERYGDELYVAPYQVLILGASGWDSRVCGAPSGPLSWRAHTKWGIDAAHRRCSIGIRGIKRERP